MVDEYSWGADWSGIESRTERAGLEAELRMAMRLGHVLFGTKVTALARRLNGDDVLFRLEDGRFAEVHLDLRPVTDIKAPRTKIYQTFEAWKAGWLGDYRS